MSHLLLFFFRQASYNIQDCMAIRPSRWDWTWEQRIWSMRYGRSGFATIQLSEHEVLIIGGEKISLPC